MSDAPQGFRRRLLAMTGLSFVLLLVALDQTVVATAMPTVVAELNGFDLYAWVGTAYLLTSVVAIPIFGKLGDDLGRKPFVLAAILVFTLASVLCGAAQDMLQLVLARALQGVGGGMLVATVFASVRDLFPQTEDRLRWQVMLMAAFGLANAFGPSLGGFITEYLGWRWVFYVNLPVGLVGLYFSVHYLPRIRHARHGPLVLDWQGALLLASMLGSLQLFVEWLPQGRPLVVMAPLLLLSLLSAPLLWWWERRCTNPLLPLGLLTDRQLWPLFLLALISGFGLFAVLFYTPLMFQGGFGLSPKAAGLLVTPLVLSITVGSLLGSRVVHRLDEPKVVLGLGSLLFALTSFGLAMVGSGTSHLLVGGVMVVGGLGLGLLLPNLTLFVQQVAPLPQMGVATAMQQSMRTIGGMLGTALVGLAVSRQYQAGVAAMPGLEPRWSGQLADPQLLLSVERSQGFRHAVAAAGGQGDALLDAARDALTAAIHGSLWWVALLTLSCLLLVRWLPSISLRDAQPAEVVAHD